MKSAQQCAPKTCGCGCKLSKPHYHKSTLTPNQPYGWGCDKCNDSFARRGNAVWAISCRCGRIYVWSFHPTSNGCWKVRSSMPLFDTGEIVATGD